MCSEKKVVDIGTRAVRRGHSYGDAGREQRSEAGTGHSTQKCWQALESDIDDTKRRIGEMTKQSQRHGRMSAEGPDESGQVKRTCNSSCNAGVKWKQLGGPGVDVPNRTLTCVKSRPRSVWNVA